MTEAEKILEEVYGSHKHRMVDYPIMDHDKEAILDCINKALNMRNSSLQLPSKHKIVSYFKKYTEEEMPEFTGDDKIVFTAGALNLFRWLNEGKIK